MTFISRDCVRSETSDIFSGPSSTWGTVQSLVHNICSSPTVQCRTQEDYECSETVSSSLNYNGFLQGQHYQLLWMAILGQKSSCHSFGWAASRFHRLSLAHRIRTWLQSWKSPPIAKLVPTASTTGVVQEQWILTSLYVVDRSLNSKGKMNL